jgi:glycosyltransferase involved in cell wall biosynthesis
MKKLRIAQLAPLIERVPPRKYGGIELVISNLTEELVRRGHEVTLFASGDSKTKARLFKVCARSLRSIDFSLRLAYSILAVDEVMEQEKKFDIIHNHAGWLPLLLHRELGSKMVTTLHGRLNTKQAQVVLGRFKKANYISISKSQRKHLSSLNYVANVYNGIDTSVYKFNSKPEDYLFFLGRISPEKGIDKAIKVVKLTKKQLIIAAKIDPSDQEYWEKVIKPQVDGKRVFYAGEVSLSKKVKLLRNAKALINPISWPEPFGLVMIEAMACGTPVIAPQKASVPEIVINGKTGFIVSNRNMIEDMASAIQKVNEISRLECRRHVEKKFTIGKMVDGYEKTYNRVLSS